MRISVVMPTLNEEENVAVRARELAAQSGDWEWIVADGGSSDGTVDLALASGATVVRSARGRGRQMDAGARVARGSVLLFLHADTALPRKAFDAVRAAMQRSEVAGGNFVLRFDDRSLLSRFFEFVYAVRQNVLKSYFGDSAIFARREVYDRIGGFGDLPIMEDYAFTIALRRHGKNVRIPLSVVTSSRRYRRRPLRALWNWFAIMSLYRLGVPAEKLARMYRVHQG